MADRCVRVCACAWVLLRKGGGGGHINIGQRWLIRVLTQSRCTNPPPDSMLRNMQRAHGRDHLLYMTHGSTLLHVQSIPSGEKACPEMNIAGYACVVYVCDSKWKPRLLMNKYGSSQCLPLTAGGWMGIGLLHGPSGAGAERIDQVHSRKSVPLLCRYGDGLLQPL